MMYNDYRLIMRGLEMKKYNVGPRKIYPNGDIGPMSLPNYPEMFINAETPAKARNIYIEKTKYTEKVSAEFICNIPDWAK